MKCYALDGSEVTLDEVAEDKDRADDSRRDISRAEMNAFDGLGPETRSVLSGAPVSLDARKLVAEVGGSTPTIRHMDASISSTLRTMIAAEYGPRSA